MSGRIALLLHMHQPEYRHPATGRPVLPWVRLHAARGYTDVATLAVEHDAPLTLNASACLTDQLAAYAAGGTDRWEDLSRMPADEIRGEDLDFVRARFVHGNPQMRARSPRYQELEARAGALSDPEDIRDLQVWSNLAWFGSVGRRDPLVAALLAKDRGFEHGELLALMDVQRRLVADVLPLWARLRHRSCSPRCHPILPLLIDFSSARRALPHIPDEVAFQWPDDARRHLAEGRDRVGSAVGTPSGLWPSEGAVSPETVALAAEAGFAWIAACEGVLERSAHLGPPAVDRPWVHDGGPPILFRDRELSDRIGFHYHRAPGEEAAADLLRAVHHRRIVPVVLDGENPWEAYPDAGEGLLRALFRSGRLVSMDEAATATRPGRIVKLHTGSWIGADLSVWAGDPADRRAWQLLAAARAAWEDAGRPEAAWEHLAAAEGSDWFWWFGPEFHTDDHARFDGLFRAHLGAAWTAMGREPPADLSSPVGRS